MGSLLALVISVVGVGALFSLNRDTSACTSKAVWLPVMWLWIDGSRSISAWLGMAAQSESPVDQLVAGILIVVGIVVIVRRRDPIVLLRLSWPVSLYFSFCLVSALWSDFPGHSLTRWIRALGDLVMAMIIVMDSQPITAFKRLLSRVGFVLLPTSVLLIKYYPDLGRQYDVFGLQWNTGVTTNKNMLGLVAFVLALGAFWQVLSLIRDPRQPDVGRRLLAQGTLLCLGIELLFTAHSATSGACFVLGVGLMLATALPAIRRRPAAVHALVLALLLAGGLSALLGGTGEVTKAMGRNSDFTGRTLVWDVVIRMAPNPVVGAGFETFWYGPRLENLWRMWEGVNEAHNGYLEVYLNLGCLGVGLIALILGQGYRKAVGAFRRDPTLGSLLLAYIVTAAVYSITEAGFRMLLPAWFFLLLSVLAANRIAVIRKAPSRSREEFADRTARPPTSIPLPQPDFAEQLKAHVVL